MTVAPAPDFARGRPRERRTRWPTRNSFVSFAPFVPFARDQQFDALFSMDRQIQSSPPETGSVLPEPARDQGHDFEGGFPVSPAFGAHIRTAKLRLRRWPGRGMGTDEAVPSSTKGLGEGGSSEIRTRVETIDRPRVQPFVAYATKGCTRATGGSWEAGRQESFHAVAVEPVEIPLGKMPRADAFIDGLGLLVPIETCPFHPRATAVVRELDAMPQQR